MSEEEMQKKMEFIVNQQAQFFSDIGALRESLDELRGNVSELTGVVTRLAQVTLARFEDTDRKISALVDAQLRTDENINRMNEDLRNLIAVVDRYFSEGRNGK